MADQDYGGKLVWFVAGVAIGSTIALLYAPASGEETRRKIGKKTREGRDALAESGRDLLERGKDMIERGKDMVERGRKLADDAGEMFERGRKIVESTAANLKG